MKYFLAHKISSRLILTLICLLILSHKANADFGKVLRDVAGALELEITPPNASLTSLDGGLAISCLGCETENRQGAPQLPIYSFRVITGDAMPQVQIDVVSSENSVLAKVLAPVRTYKTTTQFESKVDAQYYSAANILSPKIGEIQMLRGVPCRTITLPLALWAQENKTLTRLKKIHVTVTFSNLKNAPATSTLPEMFLWGIKNPLGGRFNYQTSHALRKINGRSEINIGDAYIKLSVGDRQIDGFAEDGMYAIPFLDLADSISSKFVGLSVNKIRVFTGPNDTLKAQPKGTVPDSTNLHEIPIRVVDANANTNFDAGDTIYFYGHGTSTWKKIKGNGKIQFEFNSDPYSLKNFYYLNFSATNAATAQRLTAIPSASSNSLSSSYTYLRAQKVVAIAECDPSPGTDSATGINWFWFMRAGEGSPACSGEKPSTLSGNQLFSEELDTISAYKEDSLYVGLSVLPRSTQNNFTPTLNQKTFIYNTAINKMQNGASYYSLPGPSTLNRFKFDSVYWFNGKKLEGYTFVYNRENKYVSKPFWIFPPNTGIRLSYHVTGPSDLQGLKVVDGVATNEIVLSIAGDFSDSVAEDENVRYYFYRKGKDELIFAKSNISLENLPSGNSAIRNLGTSDGVNPEYLIITPNVFFSAAQQLRSFRNDGKRAFPLKTAIVRTEDIYREFSGGRLSPVAIRDFLQYALNKWGGKSAADNPLKYVVLLGDGHFDYRNIIVSSDKKNFIPPYEWYTEVSDDFYGWFDSTSTWGTSLLSLNIGRIPIENLDQWKNIFEKIKAFEDPQVYGIKAGKPNGQWRGRVVFTADDASQRGRPNNEDPIGRHNNQSELLAKIVQANDPGLTLDKISLLDYVPNAAGQKPEAAQDLLNLLNQDKGALMVNYVGHGSEEVWADEGLLQSADALSRLNNVGKNFMINAFSCTVGRYDLVKKDGLSEQFVRAPSVGAISAVSSTRESFPDPNIALASAFYANIFWPDSLHTAITVGDALRNAKNGKGSFNGNNDAKYNLLGEPVLLLRKPPLHIAFTQAPDTLQSLGCGHIQGKIQGGSGKGFVQIKIFGGSTVKDYFPGNLETQSIVKRGNILFERVIAYENFTFDAEYLFPKAVPFGDTTALISAFAWDGSQEMEGSVAKQNIRIGSVAKNCGGEDNDGPKIIITGCNGAQTASEDFGSKVTLSLPYCLEVQVTDSLSGPVNGDGPDQGTTFEVPGILEPFHPQPRDDELRRKTYKLNVDAKNFKPGIHLLKVSARDGYGNITQRQLQMDIRSDSSLALIKVYNSPNPMKRNGTTFYFASVLPAAEGELGQDKSKDSLSFELRIYNQSGFLVRKLDHLSGSGQHWDGRDEWNNLLANGVYFYQVQVRRKADFETVNYNTLSTKRNTLVISR